MGDPTEISKLLRIKGQESVPPPEYFESFLAEFQRRQRAELLRRPLHEIIWDRLAGLAPNFRVPQLAYAMVVFVGLGLTAFLFTQQAPEGPAVALAASQPTMSLNASRPVIISETLPVRAAGTLPAQYVLPSGSVNYDQPLSF